MEYLLTHDKTLYVLNNIESSPTDKSTEQEKKDHNKFIEDDQLARATLLTFMQDDLIRVFEDFDTAKRMMDEVRKKYDMTSETHIQLLQKQHNSCKMNESDNVINHVNRMLVMAKDLAIAENDILERM
jgi:hypothetical protein